MNDPTPSGPGGRDPQEVTVNESTSREPGRPTPGADGAPRPGAAGDEALTRLRAADPAASATPDLAALREAVAARLGPAGAAAPVAGAAHAAADTEEDVVVVDRQGRTVPTDELARRRRRTGWSSRVAAVAAGALVVGGGGGYAIGAAGGGGDGTSEPAIVVADPGGGGQEAAADMAVPEMAARGGGEDAAWWPGWFSRTVFTGSGLSADGGTARAWAFDPAAAFDAQTAAAAAAALGVSGEPRNEGSVWTVGPTDGTGATVQLYADGTASLGFYDPAKDPWFCAAPGAVDGGGGGTSDGDAGTTDGPTVEPLPEVVPEPMPVEPCEERDLGPAPQGDAAESAVRDVLAALGEDAGGYDVVAEEGGDERWSYVTAHQVVDGQRTGLVWGASFTGAGLQSLNGSLAPLVDLGDYAVVSPQEAVERLGDPRFGSGGGPVAWREGSPAPDAAVSSPQGPGDLPRPPSAGSAVPWPVTEVTITEARLGAAMHTQPDGAALLLPTYELTGSDGSVWSVLALAEEHLDTAADR